ncbi:MAG TPA: orotidine-5'-phosphate decarboxylase [bacterium]|nr:orotidine-5'-phosphate decarboxylase [bacterium]
MDPRDRLIVALDVPSLEEAQAMAGRLAGVVRWYKVGLELYTAAGPAAVAAVKDGRVFLDLKFHDIPATVAGAVAAATRLGVDLLTVHASGGIAMLLAAAEAALRTAEIIGRRPPTVLGVTLLTSGDAAAMAEAGIAGTPAEAAVRLARLARAAGLGGVVASPADAAAIRAACGPDLLIVCPGIRPAGAAADDQRRVATPRAAIEAGADVLVVGRPITRAPDPRNAAEALAREIALLTSFDTPRRSVL